MISFLYVEKSLQTANGEMLNEFSSDGKLVTATSIRNNQVVIILDKKPEFIYYGWKSYSDGNLLNSDLFPTATFKIKVNRVQ